ALAAAADHPAHRDHSRAHHRRHLRRARHRPAADSQPGGAEPPAAVRRVPARHVHGGSEQDGGPGGAGVDARARLAGRRGDRRVEYLAALADLLQITAMYTNILVAIEHSDADRTVIDHVQSLAKLTGASLLLVHV